MKYFYWIFFPLLVIAGITFSVYFGLQPQSIPKITFSYFNDPVKASQAILLNQSQELKEASLLLLGVMPDKPYQLELWKAFLEQNEIPALKYQVLVVDSNVPHGSEVFPAALKLDVRQDFERFLEGAKNAEAQGLRMAVIVPVFYTAPMLKANFLAILKEKGLKPMTYSVATFPREPDQENKMEIPCVFTHADSDEAGAGPLGCAIQNKAKSVYRKKSKPGMYEGLIDQVGERDYLFLLNPPTN